jgi:hypothetical protein
VTDFGNLRINRVDITRVVGTLDGIQNITTIDQLNQQRANLASAVTDLRSHITDQDTQISQLTAQASSAQATITSLQTQNDSLQQQVTASKATIDQLNARLAQAQSQPPTPRAVDLADSFRQTVDQIQSQARQQAGTGTATTIRSLDIEVKGLVNIDAQSGNTLFVLPTVNSPIDPNQLSTMRVSFAAIPGATPAAAPPPPSRTGPSPTTPPTQPPSPAPPSKPVAPPQAKAVQRPAQPAPAPKASAPAQPPKTAAKSASQPTKPPAAKKGADKKK